MIDPFCLRIDAYLDGAMSGDGAERFESHLNDCAACREAVAQQRWIDGTLRDDAAASAASGVLLAAASHEISQEQRRRRTRRVLAGGLAAAASLALIAAWSWRTPIAAPGSAGGPTDQTIVQREATPRQSRGLEEGESSLAPSAAATFVAGSNGVAVTLESDSPEVTIVQFYPTTEADRRARRLRELETQYRELIGG